MNKQQLASLIWEYCNAMRGSITTVEYKDIILGFIFYRFFSENEVAYLTTKLGWEKEDITAENLTESDIELVNAARRKTDILFLTRIFFLHGKGILAVLQ